MMGYRVLLFSVFTVFLCSCTLSAGAPGHDCGQHFNDIYQNDDVNVVQQGSPLTQDQTWAFEETYDYFGNRTKQAPLPRTSKNGELFSADLEGRINIQINKELFSHYSFLSMAYHFYRDDINLPGFHQYFKISADEEMKHAHMFIEYLLKRGGRLKLNPVMTPCRHQWGNGVMAMEDALAIQKELLHSLRRLHALADKKNDPQMMDFIEANFFTVQTNRIKQLSDYVMTLRRIGGEALGEYQFDKLTLGGDGDK